MAFTLGLAAYGLQTIWYIRVPPSHLVYPLLWMLALTSIYPLIYKGAYPGRQSLAALVAGGAILALWMGAGVLLELGVSPYDHSPLGLALNAYRVVLPALGLEALRIFAARRYAVERDSRGLRIDAARFIAISSLFMLPQYTWNQLYTGLTGNTVDFTASRLIPALARSIMLTAMAIHAGFVAPAVASSLLGFFEVASPLLPNIAWELSGMVESLAYMVGLAIYLSIDEVFPSPFRRGEVSLKSLAMPIALALIILAPTGVFGYRASVIMSSSMEPALNVGDIVVVRLGATPTNGSIAEIHHAGDLIVHRVVGVEEDGGGVIYITKGDAVAEPDPFRTPRGHIVGVVEARIPKLGWVTILVREALSTAARYMAMLNMFPALSPIR